MPMLVPYNTIERKENEEKYVTYSSDWKAIEPLHEYGIVTPKTAEVGVGEEVEL